MTKDRGARMEGDDAGQRTGPIGRLVRAGWAIAAIATLASLIDSRGSARFRNPHVLSEPSAWFLHLLMLVVFLVLVGSLARTLSDGRGARRSQVLALVILAASGALAGGVGLLAGDAAWGFPLADAVWMFDVVMLVEEFVAFSLAILIGTPGCEIGVWAELIARARGTPTRQTGGLACVVGLHLIDSWEAARRRALP